MSNHGFGSPAGASTASVPGPAPGWGERLRSLYSGSAVLFWPFTDFAMRIFIAIAFLRSGWVKASDWDKAVYLAAEEYPVSWLSAHAAAATGLAIELVAPMLLAIGLMTRPAALALAALTIVAHTVYIPTTTNLMLIAMLIWYLVSGPAAISLDALWVRGFTSGKSGPVTLAVRAGAWLRARAGPLVVVAMRVWLGIALLALAEVFDPPIWLATWLPITSFTGLPAWLAILFAVLLITGTAASPVSYALTFVVAAFMISGVHPDVTFYPVLLLGVYEARGAGPWSVDDLVEGWLRKRYPTSAGEKVNIDDPDLWLATLKQWWRGGRRIAGMLVFRRS
ncbi:DoxX family protein [Erythrobacter sp. JK5]|uniref:DoxX family protein n=1 Tax=Erythrobacter sp. JK5 TaxID=2829500 RepID=UPI001BAA23EE|nr:DoxX family protein [Erythrobacter sp. JK5]QUL38478.1 DoxX family protein [Erythrobacter sp. JK5]